MRNFIESVTSKAKYAIGAVCACVVAAFMTVYTIDEGERGVVITFGEISSTVDAGLHWKFPWQDLKTFNIRVQKAVFGDEDSDIILSAYSYDQQIIESYRISITYQYDANRVVDIYKYFGSDEDSNLFTTVVLPKVQQTTKEIFGRYTAQTIVQERSKLEQDIQTNITDDLKDFPVIVVSTQLEDVNFSKTYEGIIEQTALKKQEIEKAQNELQKVEIESQQQVAIAKAKYEAVKLGADAQAYKITTQAKAEADAIRLKNEALNNNSMLINLTIAEKWDGKLPTTSMGNPDNILPLVKTN